LDGYSGPLCETPPPNIPPILLNPIDTIFAAEGRVFQQVLPDRTFFDPDSDGMLIMMLLDSNGASLPNTTWIQLRDNTIEGLPLVQQIRNNFITEYVFRLVAVDVVGATAHAFVVVQVIPEIPPVMNFLTIFVEGSFIAFTQSLSQQISLVTQLASHPEGEQRLQTIYVESFSAGSIAVTFSNLSIADTDCVGFQAWVDTIYDFLVSSYTPVFVGILGPFLVEDVKTPFITGPCNDSVFFPTPPFTQALATINPNRNTTLLLSILVPVLVVALLCLLAGLLALILYRRRRTERKLLITSSMEGTYLNRRPVILPGELDLPPRRGRPVVLPGDLPPARARTLRELGTHPLLEEEEEEMEEGGEYEPVPSPLRALSHLPDDPPPEYALPPLYSYSRFHDSRST
jgi:hypothetical protein